MMPTGQARLFGDVLKDDRPLLDEAASRNWSLLRIKNRRKGARRRRTSLLRRCRAAAIKGRSGWLLPARDGHRSAEDHREWDADGRDPSKASGQKRKHESTTRKDRKLATVPIIYSAANRCQSTIGLRKKPTVKGDC